MQKFIKIDPQTKLYIEDIISDYENLLIDNVLPADIVTKNIPGGLYLPRWDGTQWTEGLTTNEIKARLPKESPDWEQLAEDLRGTILFTKAYGAAEQSVAVQLALTFFNSTITASRSLKDLQFFTQDLVNKLGKTLTAEDIESLNKILESNNFEITIHASPQ